MHQCTLFTVYRQLKGTNSGQDILIQKAIIPAKEAPSAVLVAAERTAIMALNPLYAPLLTMGPRLSLKPPLLAPSAYVIRCLSTEGAGSTLYMLLYLLEVQWWRHHDEHRGPLPCLLALRASCRRV